MSIFDNDINFDVEDSNSEVGQDVDLDSEEIE